MNRNGQVRPIDVQEKALFHQKYLNYLITELKPSLTEIIQQGIDCGDIHFDHPAALAEIVLIVLTVKLDNTISPSSPEEKEEIIEALISLLEKGTDNVIVLDEPFRFLSRDLQERAGEILKTLSERMQLQIIMVSHIGEIIDVADKVFEVKKNEEGISKVKEIK